MMRKMELPPRGAFSCDPIRCFECDRCGARILRPVSGCPLCEGCGDEADRYMAALDTVALYDSAWGSRVEGCSFGFPSLLLVFVSCIPAAVTNVRFVLDGVSVTATRKRVCVAPWDPQGPDALAGKGYDDGRLAAHLVGLVEHDLKERSDDSH